MLQRSRRIFVVTFPYSVELYQQREQLRPHLERKPISSPAGQSRLPLLTLLLSPKRILLILTRQFNSFRGSGIPRVIFSIVIAKRSANSCDQFPKNVTEQNITLAIDSNLNFDILLPNLSFSTVDVVQVKLKGKIVKNTCHCTENLYQ